MALRFVDGYPYDTTSLRVPLRYSAIASPANHTIETSSGPYGDRWMKNGGSAYVRKSIGGTETTLILQFRYRPILYSGEIRAICSIMEGGTAHLTLCDNSGTPYLRRGSYAGTTIATSTAPLLANTWQQIEIKALIDNAVGTCVVKIGGTTVINYSGDTCNSANVYANTIQLGGGDTSAHWGGYAHVIVMDTTGAYCNDFLGNRRVQVFMPTGDGALTDWTPSAGANYECVDEIPPNETDYNDGGVGEKDTFTLGNISNTSATVDAIVCSMYCKTDDGGLATVKGLLRTDTPTEGEGTEVSVPASYNWVDSYIYVDPDTAAPITATAFNAAQVGYKRET